MKTHSHTRHMLPLLALAACLSLGGRAAQPANPKSTPAARGILEFFHSLTNRTGKYILSGQFADFSRANLSLLSRVHDTTGEWPGLVGVDYADFATGGLRWNDANRTAIEYWKQGGLVSVGVHLYNPANEKGGGLRDRNVAISDLLREGTDIHTRWLRQLDQLAEALAELKAAGVVVLWRPFHEMNGAWFWWGAQEPKDFIRVWQHMFTYFSDTKGLDNLLWIYGPNHGERTAAYYPGDSFADIVGLDAYTDFIDREHIRGYPELLALQRPIGFTEFGPHGSRNPPGDYDYLRLIDGLQKHFPEVTFFMSWNAKWSLASNRNTRELLAHPAILNRDDLPPALTRPR